MNVIFFRKYLFFMQNGYIFVLSKVKQDFDAGGWGFTRKPKKTKL